jgi:hypothetical protein
MQRNDQKVRGRRCAGGKEWSVSYITVYVLEVIRSGTMWNPNEVEIWVQFLDAAKNVRKAQSAGIVDVLVQRSSSHNPLMSSDQASDCHGCGGGRILDDMAL